MTRTGALIVLGVLVILAPLSGVPATLLSWIFTILGLLIIGISASLRKSHGAPAVSVSPTVEETPVHEVVPTQPSSIS